jgi:hypothetical protein
MKIKVSFEYPPIPSRNFDWLAYDDDSYDGPGSPLGHGPTREEAIADLLEKLEDQ